MKNSASFTFGRLPTAMAVLCIAGFATAQEPAKLDPPVKPSVAGKFIGNGKSADLKFVTVEPREPFSDKEAIKITFTEKDPSKSKDPSFDAGFGKLGNALCLSVHVDGGIFGCEVSHSAHEKRGFSSVGVIKMQDFKMAGGNVTGRVSTGGEQEFFGDKWEVDLTFAAPLPDKLRNAPAAPPKGSQPDKGNDPKPAPPETPAGPAGPAISAWKLPIPKDAADIDYKKLVKQIHFSCPRPVADVTKEISAGLKAQGWKDLPGNLAGKTNSILRCKNGEAELTVMIQPAGTGSAVKIFADGLDWSGGDEAAPTPPKDAPGIPGDIEAEVQRKIDEALKGLPK